ncbi:Cdc6/Cdc18 family protein [Halalkalicoccus tibetensis]|uniref:ORC1-type DNA replication protein n=1 Tax=Halalkalicoccus tibetensis TaxID=175632 RepID=A0ABD5V384_9EURY
MSKYDDLFTAAANEDSVFIDKGALDPLTEPDEIIARDPKEAELASILNGVNEGYLPPTVSIHGPPGTGKTLTTRRVCREFASRHSDCAVEYVNLKECRTLFSAANEILLEVAGERKKAYEGLDGIFEGIWTTLEEYPEYTILLLDEVDHIKHDSNYDVSDFFYRLLRGEGKLKRDITLSAWLISNQLIDVDLRLDSRVESAMGEESVYFGPYDMGRLDKLLHPRLEQGFRDGAVPDEVRSYGIREASKRWGDARKTISLFRNAGELANERGQARITKACIDDSLDATNKEATLEKLKALPYNCLVVLSGMAFWRDKATGEIAKSVTTSEIVDATERIRPESALGERAVRDVLRELETIGLVNTWIESRGQGGRVKKCETTFDPEWIGQALDQLKE